MVSYLVHRIAGLGLTLLLVLLGGFLLVNAESLLGDVGGGDGATGTSGFASTDVDSRAFRRHYRLDLPVLLNTRSFLQAEDAADLLESAHDPPPGAPLSAQREARRRLQVLGADLVPALVALLEASPRPTLARHATHRLADLVGKPAHPTAEDPVGWTWSEGASDARRAAVRARWHQWWSRHRAAYRPPGPTRVARIFTETRLAWYLRRLVHLDLGYSSRDHQPVLGQVLARLPYTLYLTVPALILACAIGIPLGFWTAIRAGRPAERGVTAGLLLLHGLPAFLLGALLLEVVAEVPLFGFLDTRSDAIFQQDRHTTVEHLRVLIAHYALPVVTLAAVSVPYLARLTRQGTGEALAADYVTQARAAGLSEGRILAGPVARNGLVSVLAMLGTSLPALVLGSVMMERVFDLPGMGWYLVEALYRSDQNAVLAVLLFTSALAVAGLEFTDLVQRRVDPRIQARSTPNPT